ncbi:MAG: glycerophosphodiester phosphodiesterase [Pseudobdellovibrionaceae bacterium]
MSFLLFIVVLVVYVFYRHYTWKAEAWPKEAIIVPPFQGHRGYWVEGAPENTMTSFEAAAAHGFSMIEMDVRLSKDNIPVVFHDTTLERMFHLNKSVEECSVAELKKIGNISTLEEVLGASSVPQLLNIELKTSFVVNSDLEKQVAALIKKVHAEQRVLFSSFNPFSLLKLSVLLPNVPRALLSTQEPDPANKVYLRHLWFAPYIKIHLLHLDHKYVSIEQLKKWKGRKVPVSLWTVNDREKAQAFLNAGALSIISDSLSS